MSQRSKSRWKDDDAMLELYRDSDGTWLVEARAPESREPPLKVVFSGKGARKEALAFLCLGSAVNLG
jgi:hypothetical protein